MNKERIAFEQERAFYGDNSQLSNEPRYIQRIESKLHNIDSKLNKILELLKAEKADK